MTGAMAPQGTSSAPRVVAIVPARDRADSIAATVRALDGVAAVDRVLVVDDGSTDATAVEASRAGAEVLRLPTNRGKGGAVAAGVAVAPEATIFLLIDADLATTAGAADRLVDPVLQGTADMTVGVLPAAGGRGGFGLVRRLSAWGVERACGLSMRAPLSGQRAVRADLLRRGLPSSGRFGLEVAMTIDAVRAGARVVEVDVPMDHRHTGRSMRGFTHRARQGLDIVVSLWPRVVPPRRRIVAVVALAVLVLVGAIGWSGNTRPTTRPLDRTPSKVILFGIQPFGFADLGSGHTPNLDRLLDQGAAAAMSVRGVSRHPSATEGYLAISSGARLAAGNDAADIVDADTPVGTMTAAEYVESLDGVTPDGDLVAVAGPDLAERNDNAEAAGRPGTLARLLGEAGHSTAVVANADRPAVLDSTDTVDRSAGLAAMDTTFGIRYGTVDADQLLTRDPLAPYGVHADADAFVDRTLDVLDRADLVVVDPGDLTRAQSYMSRATGDTRERIWQQAMERTDAILGGVMDRVDDDTLIMAVSVRPPRSEFRLTPMIMAGPGVPRGVITSPSTQRSGLVAITDVAPTVLDALDVAVPEDLPGNPLRYEPGSQRLDLLETYDADTQVRERTYVPTTWIYIWGQGLVYLLLLVVVARRPRLTALRPWLRNAALCLAALPAASFLVRLVPGLTRWFLEAQFLVTAVLSVAIGAFVATRRRNALSPLTWLCGLTVAVIVVDIWTGTHLEASSWLGYSFHSAGRFYGVPNTSFAVLGACTVLWAGILMQYTERRTETLWQIGSVMAVVLISAGAPMLGADVGTLITLTPVFALQLWVLAGRRLRLRTLILAGLAVVALVVVAAALDLLRAPEERSHLGRFASDLLANGPTVLVDSFLRKQSANFRILSGSIWTRLIPIVAAFWFIPLVWDRRGGEILGRRRALRVSAWFVVGGALLGFASNDSGPVVVALFVVWLLPLLGLLLLDAARGGARVLPADGSAPYPVDVDPGLDPVPMTDGHDDPVHGNPRANRPVEIR